METRDFLFKLSHKNKGTRNCTVKWKEEFFSCMNILKLQAYCEFVDTDIVMRINPSYENS